MMKLNRIALHGCAFALINLGSIVAGFMAYALLRPAPQLTIQIPVALAVNGLAFVLWLGLVNRFEKRLAPWSGKELAWAGAASLPASAIIFLVIHFITQNYLSSMSNLIVLWTYQIIINSLLISLKIGAPQRS